MLTMTYYVVYDGQCNLCVTFVRSLESLDKGEMFRFAPMQDTSTLQQWGIMPQDCQLGVILIDANAPERRWQGTAAAEEIGKLLPGGNVVVDTYRALPGVKWVGDRIYEQVRDNRYTLFGKRQNTYTSPYCIDGSCGGNQS